MEENKKQRQPCEIYSRVVGYIRPIDQWNPGQRSMYESRLTFEIDYKKLKENFS